jgi:hypothetical protein
MSPTTTTLTVFKATPNTQPRNKNKNKNSSDNTSTLRKASVDTTSVDVVQPQATAPSAEAENIQPPPLGISVEGTSPLNQDKDRDVRAYEHERKRAKHAGEWAKRLARKAITHGSLGVGRPAGATAAHAERRSKSLKNGQVGLDVAVDLYAVLPQKDTAPPAAKIWEGLGAGFLKSVSPPPNEGACTDASKAAQGVRVNLSELVVLSQRKPRKLNADDFEVIPHIRSVIALDDVANVHDMDLDEPWEHIYPDDDGEENALDGAGKFGRPSYARVVGTGCQ